MRKLILIFFLFPLLSYCQDTISYGNYAIKSIGDKVIIEDYVLPYKVYHVYGGFEDSVYSLALTQNNWTQITNAGNDLFSGLEADGFSVSGDTMIIQNLGDYSGFVVLTFSGQVTNEYQLRLWDATNGHQVGFKQGQTASGVGSYDQMTIPVYIENDDVGGRYVLQIQNISADNAAVLRHSQFNLTYLHN